VWAECQRRPEALQSLTVDAPGYAAYPGAPLGSVGFGCKHDQIERPAARESNGDEMAHIARGVPHRRRAARPAPQQMVDLGEGASGEVMNVRIAARSSRRKIVDLGEIKMRASVSETSSPSKAHLAVNIHMGLLT